MNGQNTVLFNDARSNVLSLGMVRCAQWTSCIQPTMLTSASGITVTVLFNSAASATGTLYPLFSWSEITSDVFHFGIYVIRIIMSSYLLEYACIYQHLGSAIEWYSIIEQTEDCTGVSVVVGQPTLITFAKDNGKYSLWVNGTLDIQQNSTHPAPTLFPPFLLGSLNTTNLMPKPYFSGNIVNSYIECWQERLLRFFCSIRFCQTRADSIMNLKFF